jgi:tetratricopeptide (TPR) repeat protein
MTNAEELKNRGIALFDQHDYEAANRIFQQAKDAYAEESRHDMVAEMKVNIGLVHRVLGELQQALEMMEEALRTFQDQGDQMRVAQTLGNLGGVYLALNDKERAELSYRQAANIFQELGENEYYSDTMMALGAMQVRDGRLFVGAATYQVALENRTRLTGTQKVIRALSNLVNRIGGTPGAK